MNREPLSDADINAGKDFGNLMQAYKAAKPPFFKAPKFWFGATAAIVATVVGVLIYTNALKLDNLPGVATETAFINPSMPEADVKRDVYVIDGGQDTMITHSTGSKLHIPANAFRDAAGNIVKGKVKLHYREFHDVVDVILAGIPMTYDSAGQRYHFETAGMMEISATQNGTALFTNPDAPIQVYIASRDGRDVFNSYYLDTAKREWQYIARANYNPQQMPAPVGAPTTEPPAYSEKLYRAMTGEPTAEQAQERAVLQTELGEVRAEIKQLEAKKPVEPKTIDKNKPRFSIKVDEKEFPEIAIYKGMKFQVVDISKYDEKKAKVMWDDITMKRVPNSLNYEITFSNNSSKYVIEATPVFDTKEYTEAKMIYNEKFEAYETALATKKAEEAKLKADIEKRANEVRAAMEREIEAQKQRQREYEANLSQTNLIYRTFTINNFGIYNCDQPQVYPSGANCNVQYADRQTKESLNCGTAYLIEKGKNAVFTLYGDEGRKLRYDPSKENLIWIVDVHGRNAIMKASEFNAAIKGKKEAVLDMEVMNGKFKSASEIKAYLQI